MEDPQITVEKLRIAQSVANSVVKLIPIKAALNEDIRGAWNKWIDVFGNVYEGITKAISDSES